MKLSQSRNLLHSYEPAYDKIGGALRSLSLSPSNLTYNLHRGLSRGCIKKFVLPKLYGLCSDYSTEEIVRRLQIQPPHKTIKGKTGIYNGYNYKQANPTKPFYATKLHGLRFNKMFEGFSMYLFFLIK